MNTYFVMLSLLFSINIQGMLQPKVKKVQLSPIDRNGNVRPLGSATIFSDQKNYMSLTVQNSPGYLSVFLLCANGDYSRRRAIHLSNGNVYSELVPLSMEDNQRAKFHLRKFFKNHGFTLASLPKKKNHVKNYKKLETTHPNQS